MYQSAWRGSHEFWGLLFLKSRISGRCGQFHQPSLWADMCSCALGHCTPEFTERNGRGSAKQHVLLEGFGWC